VAVPLMTMSRVKLVTADEVMKEEVPLASMRLAVTEDGSCLFHRTRRDSLEVRADSRTVVDSEWALVPERLVILY
jgi:hypothetical protein